MAVVLQVSFRFRSATEVQKRTAYSMEIDGKGSLILFDKGRSIIENLTLAELSDFSIKPRRSRAAGVASGVSRADGDP